MRHQMSATAQGEGQGQLGFIRVQKVSDNGTKLKCFLCFMTTLESQSHDITHIPLLTGNRICSRQFSPYRAVNPLKLNAKLPHCLARIDFKLGPN